MPKKPKKIEVWTVAILTREPGTFIVGETEHWQAATMCALTTWLRNPALMKRNGSNLSFEKLDVFDGFVYVRLEGQLAGGCLGEPYLTHYRKFLTASVAPKSEAQ